MKTIFLCYEMNPKTGLSKVKDVNENINFAKNFILAETKTVRRVEEWELFGTYSNIVGYFDSIEEFEGRK